MIGTDADDYLDEYDEGGPSYLDEYGEGSTSRQDLVPLALGRWLEREDLYAFPPCEVIGDGPGDVQPPTNDVVVATVLASLTRRQAELDWQRRLVVAYAREFVRPAVPLAELAAKTGLSISGVRTFYDTEEIAELEQMLSMTSRRTFETDPRPHTGAGGGADEAATSSRPASTGREMEDAGPGGAGGADPPARRPRPRESGTRRTRLGKPVGRRRRPNGG